MTEAFNQVVRIAASGAARTGPEWATLCGLVIEVPSGWRDGWEADLDTELLTWPQFRVRVALSTVGGLDAVSINLDLVDKALDEMFCGLLGWAAYRCHTTARSKGFWEDREAFDRSLFHPNLCEEAVDRLLKVAQRQSLIEELALVGTELAEAIEGIRNGDPPDDKVPEYHSSEAELVDVLVRVLDCAGGHGLRLGPCFAEKTKYNKGREYRHGKQA